MIPHRRRWTWKGRLLLLGLAALVAGGAYSWHAADGWRLDALRRRLDREQTGWRWADQQAEFVAGLPPDDQNPMVALQAIDAKRQAVSDLTLQARQDESGWLFAPAAEANRRPPADEEAGLRCLHEPLRPIVGLARPAADSRGPSGVRYAYAPDVISTNCGGQDAVSAVGAALRFDAIMAALDGDGDTAVADVRAHLGVGRAVGDDPFGIAQQRRATAAQMTADALERVLALCEPAAGLAELQAELAAEAEHPRLRLYLRGERAMIDAVFENFGTGRDDLPSLYTRFGFAGTPDRFDQLRFRLARNRRHRAVLDWYTRMLRALDEPESTWPAAAAAMPSEPDLMLLLGVRGCSSFGQSMPLVPRHLWWTARLRSAAAAVACERFRRKHGRWPASWVELAEFLPAVPADPFRAGPLILRPVPGGLLVYSVGADGTDDNGTLDATNRVGTDVGFRLFDPDQRNRPPEDE